MKRPVWIVYIFGILSMVILLIYQWSSIPDSVNPWFGQDPLLLGLLYYLTVVMLLAGYGYFGYQALTSKKIRKIDHIFLGLTFIAASLLYLGSFNPVLSPNGDNAEYIINAKSLVDRGGFFRLDTPTETPNSIASIGLPLLLAPSYAIWGLNFLPMKILIMIISLATGPLFFIFLRQEFDFFVSALLGITGFLSPYLIAHSTMIVTEAPYLFWCLTVLIVFNRFDRKKVISWPLLLLLFFLLVWTYLTRAVGVALIIAILMYFISRLPWLQIIQLKISDQNGRLLLAKFVLIAFPLIAGFIFWQYRQQQLGVSQLGIFMQVDWWSHISHNFTALTNVAGHLFFSPDAFRWYKQSADHFLSPVNLFWILIQLIILIGLVSDLRQKKLVAFYSLALILTILAASLTPQERVIIRYLSVLIPFLIYHFYRGILVILNHQILSKNKHWTSIVKAATFGIIGLIFVTHLSANRYNVLTKGAVYNVYYESFLTSAKWCGQNLPAGSYVMSVKPRIVYLYSGLPGLVIGNERDIYTPEYEKQKLEEIKLRGITHIIVDAISNATIKNFYPVIQNNPDKFEKLPVPGLGNKCTVLKVRPY